MYIHVFEVINYAKIQFGFQKMAINEKRRRNFSFVFNLR